MFSSKGPAKGTHALRSPGHQRYGHWEHRPSRHTENTKIVSQEGLFNEQWTRIFFLKLHPRIQLTQPDRFLGQQ